MSQSVLEAAAVHAAPAARIRHLPPPAPAGRHIAIFLPALGGGGAERVMVHLAAGLVQHGVAVDMVLGNASGPYLEELDPAVRIVDLKARRVVPKLIALTRYLRRERPTGVVSVLDNVNLATLARNAARVDAGVAVGIQNTLSSDLGVDRSPKGWVRRRLMRTCHPWADHLVCVSEGVAQDLAALIRVRPGRLEIIHNPVPIEDVARRSRACVDHPWFRDAETPVVLAVGRLTRQKDYPTLLRAFAGLRASRRAHLMILGEGEDRGVLKGMVDALNLGPDVAMPGFVRNPYAYMAKADLFVMASRWEGLPTVMIEALACGARVVSTDCPSGPREILAGGTYGRLVPMGDACALAAAMGAALDRPHRPEVSRARAGVFGLDRAVHRYMNLFGITTRSSVRNGHGAAPAAVLEPPGTLFRPPGSLRPPSLFSLG